MIRPPPIDYLNGFLDGGLPLRGVLVQFLTNVISELADAQIDERELEATSWWRSAASNAAVGGNRSSQHLIGAALDFVSPSISYTRLRRALAASGQDSVNEGDHVHVEYFRTAAGRTLLDATGRVLLRL